MATEMAMTLTDIKSQISDGLKAIDGIKNDIGYCRQRMMYLEKATSMSLSLNDCRRSLRSLGEEFCPELLESDMDRKRWVRRRYQSEVLDWCCRASAAESVDVKGDVLKLVPAEVTGQCFRDVLTYGRDLITNGCDVNDTKKNMTQPLKVLNALRWLSSHPDAEFHYAVSTLMPRDQLMDLYRVNIADKVSIWRGQFCQVLERLDEIEQLVDGDSTGSLRDVKQFLTTMPPIIDAKSAADEICRIILLKRAAPTDMTG